MAGTVIGYEHICEHGGGYAQRHHEQSVVPICDFKDAYETQRVLEAAVLADPYPVKLSEVK